MANPHEEIRASVREFVLREVEPIANQLDREEKEIPESLLRKMAELGYFGLTVPEAYGGMGLDYTSMCIVTEELARGWLSVGSVATRNLITGTLLLSNGTEEQKRRWLPGLAAGRLFSAAAFTEPDYGSDTASMKLRAARDGQDYVLTGEKTWCTFANRAHLLTVIARTDGEVMPKHKGLSLFLVEKEPGDGFSPPTLTGEPIPTIGYKGMRSYGLHFDAVRVPAGNLVGLEAGKGFYQLMATYESARLQTAARAVGVGQAALDCAIRYAKERVQFDKPIAEFQVIRHKLAHMSTQLAAARQLCYHAARMKDTGKRCDLEAGQAKAFAAEMAEYVTNECLQIHGGYGYSKEFSPQRYWRDARIFRIFEGTSEIQYEVIAKRILQDG